MVETCVVCSCATPRTTVMITSVFKIVSTRLSMMMIMMGWLVVATALFLLRPNSMRGGGDRKPTQQGPPGQVGACQAALEPTTTLCSA